MPDEFCPRCGQVRTGALRFCRACGFEFDDAPPVVATSEIQPSTGWIAPPKGRPIRRYVGVGIAVFVGLAVVGNLTRPESISRDTSPAGSSIGALPSLEVKSTSTKVPSGAAAAPLEPEGATVKAVVIRVVDGDTIVVKFGGAEHRVRYIGIDSPETVDPKAPAQWMGAEATAMNALLVEGETVFLQKDVSDTDTFGRLLRHVWLTDGSTWTLVNLELVRQGVAIAKSYPPDVRYDDLYRVAEGDAQGLALGLWGPTPLPPTPKPTPKKTPKPAEKPAEKPKPALNCHPSYAGACLKVDAGDYDCAGGSGNGPNYTGLVRIVGPDVFDLDRDGDGLGCE